MLVIHAVYIFSRQIIIQTYRRFNLFTSGPLQCNKINATIFFKISKFS